MVFVRQMLNISSVQLTEVLMLICVQEHFVYFFFPLSLLCTDFVLLQLLITAGPTAKCINVAI